MGLACFYNNMNITSTAASDESNQDKSRINIGGIHMLSFAKNIETFVSDGKKYLVHLAKYTNNEALSRLLGLKKSSMQWLKYITTL